MKPLLKLTASFVVFLTVAQGYAQPIRENQYTFGPGFDHSAWKAISNFPTGYIIAGSKFFEPNNTATYLTGFNDLSQQEWATSYTTTQHGFTQLQVLWKSFTNSGPPENPTGVFVANTGTRNGQGNYYTLLTDKTGQLLNENFGPAPGGWQFGGACQATDGGYIVSGSSNAGDVIVVKFDATGAIVSSTTLEISGFGWSVQPADGGGYVIGSTKATAIKVNSDLGHVWTSVLPLPPAPPPDGSNYTYTEFEEILPLRNAGEGFVMTGSCFSNSHSGVYSGKLDWNGQVLWSKINETTSTALAGTPVCWTNSAVEHFNMNSGAWDILYTWRCGPVSAGGMLFYERMNPANGNQLIKAGLNNTIPVQEAFTVRQHYVNRVVIAGTRGGYSAAYSYSIPSLP